MKTIIYVHGLESNFNSNKSNVLKHNFSPEYNVVGQNYNYDTQSPTSIIKSLTQFCFSHLKNSDDQVFLVGSSLGGFITLNVLNRINAKAVLVNPSVSPHINLNKRNNKFTQEYYDLSKSLPSGNYKNVLCLISKDDEVIDLQGLNNFNFQKVMTSGGGHRMTNFDSHIDMIKNYFENSSLLEEHGLFLD